MCVYSPSHEKSSRDTFQRGEFDSPSTEEWVEEVVHDGDKDDEGEWVEVGDDVVGDTAQVHCCCLGGKVV